MFDLAQAAVEGALAAGATYADARGLLSRQEGITVQNAAVESLDVAESAGVGVRALIGSSWGFYAVAEPTDSSARKAGEEAAAIARASGMVAGPKQTLSDVPVNQDEYRTPFGEDPFQVPLSDKVDLLVAVTRTMMETAGVALAKGNLNFWGTEKWFVSSQGHRIFQHLVESGGGISALAIGESETQARSYPQSFGHYETGGYEVIRRWDYAAHAPRVAEEAVALLSAAEMEEGETTIILESSQVALQIHESVGHAIELDRILGWEAAFAGTSHLELERLHQHKYGSELMNITADATLPGALGSFGYDDEGTPAQRVPIVDEGTWVGVLSGRDSASIAGLPPGGMVRADGYNRLPMVRMTNVGLLPGSSSLEEMIAETESGYLMDTNRSWSIDDRRLNFQFGCELGREIKNGQLGKMVKNPTYTGITPGFWGSMDMIGNQSEWVFWGLPNCGKGQPMQLAHTAHQAVPARFRDVRVGVRGSRRTAGIVEGLLEAVGSGVETEVTVTESSEALTRFANSYIHQNVAEDGPRVTLKVALDGRLASASTNRIGSESLAKLAHETIDIAKLQPVDPDWPGLAAREEIAPLSHWDEETASASPADRARLVKDFVDAGPGFEAAGYCETTSTSVTFANSAGHYVEDRYTSAVIDGIHRAKTVAGSGHATSTRLSDLNGTEIGGLAARRANDSLGAVDVKAGEYEVVLAPECVATICVFMAVYGFNAKVHQEGQSFVKVGEAQFDPDFRLLDDASDSRALRIGFDSEGTRKAGLVLVEDGVSKNLVHDRRTAAKAGEASTGHALNFFGGYLGPAPTDLFVGSGSSTEDDLIKGVERGIYVATFNYCRVLDPKTLVVTGLTRNGTFLIENGEITTPITNLRFTQSFVEALGPGRVTGVGSDGRHADSEFGAGFIHCPTLRLASWNFTGGASG